MSDLFPHFFLTASSIRLHRSRGMSEANLGNIHHAEEQNNSFMKTELSYKFTSLGDANIWTIYDKMKTLNPPLMSFFYYFPLFKYFFVSLLSFYSSHFFILCYFLLFMNFIFYHPLYLLRFSFQFFLSSFFSFSLSF